MNSVQIKTVAAATKLTQNTDRKHVLNEFHRVSRKNQGKQPITNASKKIKKAKNKSQVPIKDDPSTRIFRIMQDQVHNQLMRCGPGQELEVLHHALKPDNNTLWLKCMEVKKDLLLAFQRSYPDVRLEVFGSTVMGIAFKDSDFDFFIELSPEPLNAKPASVIGKAMNILRQNGSFTNFLPISHARVPILKCYHIRTGYQCDINFSDSYGILNSPIVARLLVFDPRIYVLATILKYWTKVHDCAGKNRISNYAIVWMLLFYLQQLPIPILPPISEFQRRVRPRIINGYNFAYDDRLPNQTQNQNRCSELLMGFFKFYRGFDFESHVICPLYGKIFQKANILAKKVPNFQRYYEMLNVNSNLSPLQLNKCICIQDPFEITHSIPGVIANLEFQKIIWKFEYAADIIETELKSNGESTRLLLLLFDGEKFVQYCQQKLQQSPNDLQSKKQTAVFRSQSNVSLKATVHIKPTDYHLSIVREILTRKNIDSNVKIDNQAIHKSWCEHVINFIVLILEDIFKLKIVKSKSIINNTEKPSTSSEINNIITTPESESERFTKFFCIEGSRDVFLGRKQTKKITINSLNAEMLDSIERFKNNSKEIKLEASVNITTNTFDDITVDIADLIKTKKNNSFKTFLTNFDQNLNNLLKICFVHKSGNVINI